MAIVTDQAFGNNFDPGSGPTLPQALTVITITLDDANNDGVITATSTDTVNGSDVTSVYNGDTVTLSDGTTITGTTVYTADGGRYFTPTDGTVLQPSTATAVGFVTESTQLTVPSLGPPCFVAGTNIMTGSGQRPIEDLSEGDLVMTRDNGLQPIRWIGSRTLNLEELRRYPNYLPVRISKGAMGKGLPVNDLVVSRQHRMVVSSKVVRRMFDVDSVLVAAHRLTELRGIDVDGEVDSVEYIHLLFDRHEVIFAEGTPTESLFVGRQALECIGRPALAELLGLFPELANRDHDPKPALMMPKAVKQKKLVARQKKNNRPALEHFDA